MRGRHLHNLVCVRGQLGERKVGCGGQNHLNIRREPLKEKLLQEGLVECRRALTKKGLHVAQELAWPAVAKVFCGQELL